MTRVAMSAKIATSRMCRPFVRAQCPRFSNVEDILALVFPLGGGGQTQMLV
jgi:hypothetical protein